MFLRGKLFWWITEIFSVHLEGHKKGCFWALGRPFLTVSLSFFSLISPQSSNNQNMFSEKKKNPQKPKTCAKTERHRCWAGTMCPSSWLTQHNLWSDRTIDWQISLQVEMTVRSILMWVEPQPRGMENNSLVNFGHLNTIIFNIRLHP